MVCFLCPTVYFKKLNKQNEMIIQYLAPTDIHINYSKKSAVRISAI